MSFITGKNLTNQKSLTSLGNKLVIAGGQVVHVLTGFYLQTKALGREELMTQKSLRIEAHIEV